MPYSRIANTSTIAFKLHPVWQKVVPNLHLGQKVKATPKSGFSSDTDLGPLSIFSVNAIVLAAWGPGFESPTVFGCIW